MFVAFGSNDNPGSNDLDRVEGFGIFLPRDLAQNAAWASGLRAAIESGPLGPNGRSDTNKVKSQHGIFCVTN
jgi:hypothetical protein